MHSPRFLCLLLLFIACPALAGSIIFPADVSVDFSADPNTGLFLGQPITFTISATNHGPAPVEALAISSFEFSTEFAVQSGSTDCQNLGLLVGDGNGVFYYIYNLLLTFQGALEVGETRTCHLILPLSATAPETFTFGFEIRDFFVDIDPSNNIASVTLRRALELATPIPTLSPVALLLLAGLLAWNGAIARKSRS